MSQSDVNIPLKFQRKFSREPSEKLKEYESKIIMNNSKLNNDLKISLKKPLQTPNESIHNKDKKFVSGGCSLVSMPAIAANDEQTKISESAQLNIGIQSKNQQNTQLFELQNRRKSQAIDDKKTYVEIPRRLPPQIVTANYNELKRKTKLNNERLKESLEAIKRQSQEGNLGSRRVSQWSKGPTATKNQSRVERPHNNHSTKRREFLSSQESVDPHGLSSASRQFFEGTEKASQIDFKTLTQLNINKLEGEHDNLRDLLLTTQKGGFTLQS